MKTLISSFFRKKSIYIYIVLYTLIFTVITLLMIFNNYYDELIKTFYSENTFFLVKSTNDLSDALHGKKITKFETGALYLPSDYTRPLTFVNDDNINENNFNDNSWQFFISMDFDGILIFKDEKLVDNEITLSFPEYYESYEQNIDIIPNSLVNIGIGNDNYVLKIIEYNFKDCYQINVSKDIFHKIFNQNNLYLYKIKPSLDISYKQIESELDKLCHTDNLCDYEFYQVNSSNKLNDEDMLNTIRKMLIVFGFMFLIIFIILTLNKFNDDKKIMKIYSILGFRNVLIKSITLLQQVIINEISLFISFVASASIVYIIRTFMNVNLKLISISIYGIINLILIILLFVLCCIYKTDPSSPSMK